MNLLRYLSITIVLIALPTPQPAYAVAFCALRDPVGAMQVLYPEADSHYSIVRIIDPKTRDHVADRLPFSLHFNELGKHTLYVAMNNQRPLGFIHSRSEPSDWGLVEIVWSLNLDLSIRDFQFQRCRSDACEKLESPFFKAQLQGKSVQQLRQFIAQNGESIRDGSMIIPSGANDLAFAVLRSAMKTSVVTEYAWQEDLISIRMKDIGTTHFPDVDKIHKIEVPYDEETNGQISSKLQGANTAVVRNTVTSYHFVDANSKTLGHVISSELDLGTFHGRYIWAFTPDGRVEKVIPVGDWKSPDIHQSFVELEGKKFTSDNQCDTALSLATYELMMTFYPADDHQKPSLMER